MNALNKTGGAPIGAVLVAVISGLQTGATTRVHG